MWNTKTNFKVARYTYQKKKMPFLDRCWVQIQDHVYGMDGELAILDGGGVGPTNQPTNQPTSQPTNQPTNGRTKQGVESRARD